MVGGLVVVGELVVVGGLVVAGELVVAGGLVVLAEHTLSIAAFSSFTLAIISLQSV